MNILLLECKKVKISINFKFKTGIKLQITRCLFLKEKENKPSELRVKIEITDMDPLTTEVSKQAIYTIILSIFYFSHENTAMPPWITY